jgi:hypothetical protein
MLGVNLIIIPKQLPGETLFFKCQDESLMQPRPHSGKQNFHFAPSQKPTLSVWFIYEGRKHLGSRKLVQEGKVAME